MNLSWEDEAKLELSEAAVHYFYEEPGVDERFLEEVERAAKKVVSDPYRYREFDPPYRKIATGKFPYQLVFFIQDDVVWISAVMHQSRKPGYWKDRG